METLKSSLQFLYFELEFNLLLEGFNVAQHFITHSDGPVLPDFIKKYIDNSRHVRIE